MGWGSGKRYISAWSNVCLVVEKENMCVGAWTELLESEASRGAKRTQQGVDNVKWNGLNVIRDAVVRFVLLFWKVIKIREHALSFPLCFLYEWNSECLLRAFREVTCVNTLPRLERSERLAPTRERTTPGWWKTSLKRALACLGVFWGFLPSEAKPYFFLVQNKKEYVPRHTPTPKNRSSLEKRIPNE